MMGLWETWTAVSGQRQREFQEFPPDVCLLCLKLQILREVSNWKLSFYHLTESKKGKKTNTFSFCLLAYFQKYHQIFALCYESKRLTEISYTARQKGALQTSSGKFCFPTGFSASFPDILFPQSDSTLRYDWVRKRLWVRACVWVCILWCKCTEKQAGLCYRQGSSGGFVW